MAERLAPNPFSPFADADPSVRHLVPSFFGLLPDAGVLTVAGCGGMVVVPDGTLGDATDALAAGRLDDLPPGLCAICVAVATGQRDESRGGPGTCRECGDGSSHGDLCALCRQELHAVWWATREEAKSDG